MSPFVLLDTGPLVALLDKRDEHHGWATGVAGRLPPPWATCEAVISEACFLTSELPTARHAILAMLRQSLLTIGLRLDHEAERIATLMDQYADLPMDLADACLVRMSELVEDSAVLTLDNDFRIYRRNGRRTIPLLIPPAKIGSVSTAPSPTPGVASNIADMAENCHFQAGMLSSRF